MKTNVFKIIIILLLLNICNIAKSQSETKLVDETERESDEFGYGTLKIYFDFSRGGIASSQYAIWIEDSKGRLVKNVYVTKFTAEGGYLRREDCLPTWVYKVNPENFATGYVDAFTGATPRNGKLTYYWNGTNDKGEMLPVGEYNFFLECTLFWDSCVLYSGKVTLGGSEQESIEIDSEYYKDSNKNRNIIKNVEASYLLNL